MRAADTPLARRGRSECACGRRRWPLIQQAPFFAQTAAAFYFPSRRTRVAQLCRMPAVCQRSLLATLVTTLCARRHPNHEPFSLSSAPGMCVHASPALSLANFVCRSHAFHCTIAGLLSFIAYLLARISRLPFFRIIAVCHRNSFDALFDFLARPVALVLDGYIPPLPIRELCSLANAFRLSLYALER